MSLPEPKVGLVIRYAYLWRHEARAGREEAAKDRPCVVVLAVRSEEKGTVVTVAPITTRAPFEAEIANAIELPPATKRRLGLDEARSWAMATDLNRFTWPGVDLRPIRPNESHFDYGFLPAAMTEALRRRVLALAIEGRRSSTDRDE